jgi:hypothetical protein
MNVLKLDSFEQDKVEAVKLIKLLKDSLEALQSGNQSNETIRGMQQNISKLETMSREMGALVDNMNRKQGVWKTNSATVEMRKQREADWKEIRTTTLKIKKKVLFTMSGGSPGSSSKPQSVNEFIESSKSIFSPDVDISEGLKQIEDLKRERDGLLGVLDNQLDTLQGISNSQGDELQKQGVILDNISNNVDKQNAMLKKMNKKKSCCVVS